MIERLQRALAHAEQLPPDLQEEIAAQIEALIPEESSEAIQAPDQPNTVPHSALDLAGAWSDIPWESMEQELDRIRHSNPPTPPVELDEL